MTKSTNRSRGGADLDRALERALEGLFRLGANRRFDARQAEVVGADVTRAGYAVLRCLADAGTLGLRAVADACAMDGATASRQVGALVDDGLVDRRTAADDARAVELSLTPRGREVYERIVDHRLALLSGVVATWPAEDRAHLARLVERLTADLSAAPLPRADRGA
jgi:DNA-binding MarR family transcriptional regulator